MSAHCPDCDYEDADDPLRVTRHCVMCLERLDAFVDAYLQTASVDEEVRLVHPPEVDNDDEEERR